MFSGTMYYGFHGYTPNARLVLVDFFIDIYYVKSII